ncbi:hypothetical protein BH23ACT9_BH23ACT9_32100 [soil metagenome]
MTPLRLRLTRPHRGGLATVGLLLSGGVAVSLLVTGSGAEGAESAVAVGAIVLVSVIAGLVAVWNRRIVIEEGRVGIDRGFGRVAWMAAEDVLLIAPRRVVDRGHVHAGILLMGATGGNGRLRTRTATIGVAPQYRERIRSLEGEHHPLRSLFLPTSEMGLQAKSELVRWLKRSLPTSLADEVSTVVERSFG